MTKKRFTQEAERLLALDERGREAELLARALEIQHESDLASRALHEMDKQMLSELIGSNSDGGTSTDTTGTI